MKIIISGIRLVAMHTVQNGTDECAFWREVKLIIVVIVSICAKLFMLYERTNVGWFMSVNIVCLRETIQSLRYLLHIFVAS